MLAHIRARILEKLVEAGSVMLASSGTAGIQISACPARPVGLRLYLLIPAMSDHLLNLEQDPIVTITSDLWRLNGLARLRGTPCPFTDVEARWHRVVEIRPSLFEFLSEDGQQVAETIDVEESDLADSRQE